MRQMGRDFKIISPGTQVHSCQDDLLCATIQCRLNICQDIVYTAASARTTGKPGDTIGAMVISSILNLNKGTCAQAGPRDWLMLDGLLIDSIDWDVYYR